MTNQSTKPALKTNFAIRTTDENFRMHIETLKALGYRIYCEGNYAYMGGWDFLNRGHTLTDEVYRSYDNAGKESFNNIQDFLAWHFTPEAPEKSEAEILLDSLEEDMQQLQAKVAEVRNVINKDSK